MTTVADLVAAAEELLELWPQLQRSVAHQGQSAGTPRAVSRVPIALSVVSLTLEISTATGEAAEEYGTGARLGTLSGDLATIIGWFDVHDLDEAETLTWWVDACRDWTARARLALGLTPPGTRAVRGVACPRCASLVGYAIVDHELVRMPALIVTWEAERDSWRVHGVRCRCCGASWDRDTGELAGLALRLLTHLATAG